MPFPRARLAAALALSVGFGASADAFEHTRFESLWITPVAAEALRPVPSLLNLPQGWQSGDAAAVLLFDPPGAHALRDAVLVALLDRGAAVLELDANAAHGFSADSGRDPPPPTRETLLQDLAGALVALRRDAGAGLVVAIGHGLGGEAVMLAADPSVAAAAFGAEGPRFTAVAALGPGQPRFAAGPPPPAAEGWSGRAPILCEVLAWAHGAAATPLPEAPEIRAREAVAVAACRAALPDLSVATLPGSPAGRW